MTNQQLREQLAQSVYEKIVHKMRDRQLSRADAVRETVSETSAGVLPWSDALKRIDEEFGPAPSPLRPYQAESLRILREENRHGLYVQHVGRAKRTEPPVAVIKFSEPPNKGENP